MALQFEWKHSPGVLAGLGVRLSPGQRELLEADEAFALVPWAVPDPYTIWEAQGKHLKDPCTDWQSNVIPVLLEVMGDGPLDHLGYSDDDEPFMVSQLMESDAVESWRDFPSVLGHISSHPLEDEYDEGEFPDLFRVWDAVPCTLDQGLTLQHAGRVAFENSLWHPHHELFGLENFGTHEGDDEYKAEKRKEIESKIFVHHDEAMQDMVASHPSLTPAERKIWQECLTGSRRGWEALLAAHGKRDHSRWYEEKERNPWY